VRTNDLALLRRWLTVVLWGFFLVGQVLLFALERLSGRLFAYLVWLWLVPIVLIWLVLLIRHVRFWGQWRGLVLAWGTCTLALVIANRRTGGWLQEGAMLVAFYTLLAGWFAAFALILRRDVSIVYLVLFFLLGPLYFRAQMVMAGSVLGLFTGGPTGGKAVPSPLDVPMMLLACLLPLGLLGFGFHFLRLLWREGRRWPLASPQRSAMAEERV
jgi:hypothetical protein